LQNSHSIAEVICQLKQSTRSPSQKQLQCERVLKSNDEMLGARSETVVSDTPKVNCRMSPHYFVHGKYSHTVYTKQTVFTIQSDGNFAVKLLGDTSVELNATSIHRVY